MDVQRPAGYSGDNYGSDYAAGYRTEPEILPPANQVDRQAGSNLRADDARFGAAPPPQRSGSSKPRWAYAPATYVLVGINCLVYVLMVLKGVSPVSPTSSQLLHFGANYGGLVLLNAEWWRLLTAAFVHIGFIHLATNMWCLWNLGLLGEPLLGPAGMVAVYFFSGIAGNLLSIAMNPHIVGAGASGAVFGLAGVLILLLKSPLLPVPPAEIKRLRHSVIFFAILNFAIGAGTSLSNFSLKIDNFAHLGGFLCGMMMGLFLVPRIGAPRQLFLTRQKIAFPSTALVLMLVAYGTYTYWFPILLAQFQNGVE